MTKEILNPAGAAIKVLLKAQFPPKNLQHILREGSWEPLECLPAV